MSDPAWNYEAQYKTQWGTEPLPLVDIVLLHAVEGPSESLTAFIDTGSPFCLMPREFPRRLDIPPWRTETLATINNQGFTTRIYFPVLEFEGWDRQFKAIKFGVWQADFGLIGRNLLGRLELLLKGASQELKIR